jgi:O-antigen ligase
LLARLDQASRIAVLAMVPCMLHAFVVAELCIAVIGVSFLVRSAVLSEWRWARSGWFPLALVWWVWLVVCTLPGISESGTSSLMQALVVIRYPVMVAAVQHGVLRDPATRVWLWRVIALCAAYIGLQVIMQTTLGFNLYGDVRWGDGQVTGPFFKPRAGAPMAALLFPAVLPVATMLLARRTTLARLGAGVLTVVGLLVVVLIGQRVPVLLTLLELLVAALLLPSIRRPAMVALVAAAVLIGASAVVVPPTFYRLVTKFSTQMEHFRESPYGLILRRASVIAGQHPWHGRGFNGFRTGCADPATFHGWNWPADPTDDGGGLAGCNLHPHNPYLQAVTDSGFPGLVMFVGLAVIWLATVGRGLWRRPDALRVGLFVAALGQLWPLAATSSAFAIEIGGLFYLLLGFGLSEARLGESRLPVI